MDVSRGLRILYAYEQDASNLNVQSGRPHAILNALRSKHVDVTTGFPLRSRSKIYSVIDILRSRMNRRIYRYERNKENLINYACQVERLAAMYEPDLIFSPSSLVVSALSAKVPAIFCADATFASMLDYYPQFSNLDRKYIQEGMEQERMALRNCAAAIYPSAWAADSAISDHGAARERVHVIPFGSSVVPPLFGDVEIAINNRSRDGLKLLFIGREWERKGGNAAVAVTRELRELGIDAVLNVVGPSSLPTDLPYFVKSHGFLNRRVSSEEYILKGLISQSHFLLSLSNAEAFGLAACDAYAYGLPVIARAVGGVPDVVQNGRNGRCFGVKSSPREIAEFLSNFEGPSKHENYKELCRSARESYDRTFNWTSFTCRLLQVAREAVLHNGQSRECRH